MIVISGALVLVALVLLVIGLINPDLAFVYASIGVSLASFAFLIVGILQRRKEDLPDGESAAATTADSGVTAGAESEGVTTLPVVMRKPAGAAEAPSGAVLVVAGRPRYHVDGCRYLTGKDADEVQVADAREEGFTACGVCKPDDNLTAVPAHGEIPVVMSKGTDATPADEPAFEDVAQEALPSTVPATALAKSPTRTAAKSAARPAAKAATAPAKATTRTAAKAAPAKTPAAAAAKPAKAPAKTAAKAAPAKASPAKRAAAVPVKRGGVIVIPDRGKFHTPDCRYVRGADGTLELTKAAATKQGYDACGVCNP